MGFWQNVDAELKFSGMSRKELAVKADFPDSYISKGIKRNSMPAADLAVRISHVLKTPLESLLSINEKQEAIINENKEFFEQWKKLSSIQKEKLIEFLRSMSK